MNLLQSQLATSPASRACWHWPVKAHAALAFWILQAPPHPLALVDEMPAPTAGAGAALARPLTSRVEKMCSHSPPPCVCSLPPPCLAIAMTLLRRCASPTVAWRQLPRALHPHTVDTAGMAAQVATLPCAPQLHAGWCAVSPEPHLQHASEQLLPRARPVTAQPGPAQRRKRSQATRCCRKHAAMLVSLHPVACTAPSGCPPPRAPPTVALWLPCKQCVCSRQHQCLCLRRSCWVCVGDALAPQPMHSRA